MVGEASGAFGELYEVLDGSPTTIELSATPDTYAKWVSGSQGKISPTGLVRVEADDLDTWSAVARYPLGSKVSHSGHNWVSKEASLTAWDIATTYAADDLVSYGGEDYKSLVADNTGHLPNEAGSDWWGLGNINQEPAGASDYWTDAGERGERLVIQEGGKGTYQVTAVISFVGTAGSIFTWGIHRNGVLITQMLASAVAVEGIRYPLGITGLIDLLEGDYLDVAVAGNNISDVATIYSLSFNIHRIYEA